MTDPAQNVPAAAPVEREAALTKWGPRGLLWIAGLVVALGAGATTAHGLYEVAVAARVPVAVAWLYPVITDGLALVAYASTARLSRSARRYAWVVVVVAAGLSGLAQATYLAGAGPTTASVSLRFGIGAWPAIAAATVAHLLYLISTPPLDVPVRAVPTGQPSADVPVPVRVDQRPASQRPAKQPIDDRRPEKKPRSRAAASPRAGRATRSDAELLAQLSGRTEPMSVRAAARELGTGPDRARRLLRESNLLASPGSEPDDPATGRGLHVVHTSTTEPSANRQDASGRSTEHKHESRNQP